MIEITLFADPGLRTEKSGGQNQCVRPCPPRYSLRGAYRAQTGAYDRDGTLDRSHILNRAAKIGAGIDHKHRQPTSRISMASSNQLVAVHAMDIAGIARPDGPVSAGH